MLRQLVKRLVPYLLPSGTYRRIAFSRIYRKKAWGSEGTRFFSGVGSRGAAVTTYVDALALELDSPRTIVDLGCGDFEVGRALLARYPQAKYIGCDIVPNLVKHLQNVHGSDRVNFRLVDIVDSRDLPEGDMYLIRQVFQHLSNDDILRVLEKLIDRPCLIVSEGQPLVRTGPVNPDKVASAHT